MTLYLLDTNMVSFIINGHSPAARARLASLQRANDRAAGVSSITAGEILFGLARLESKGEGQRKRKAIDQLVSALPIHPWDRAAAEVSGRLRAQQGSMGKPLGPSTPRLQHMPCS